MTAAQSERGNSTNKAANRTPGWVINLSSLPLRPNRLDDRETVTCRSSVS
jgi:hypothetical protein